MISEEIIKAIVDELTYQETRHGIDKQQSLPGYMLIMEHKLNDAKSSWNENHWCNRQTPLEEIVQVVAVGIKCLQTYGVTGSAVPTNDIPTTSLYETSAGEYE